MLPILIAEKENAHQDHAQDLNETKWYIYTNYGKNSTPIPTK
jgi:hypothetical protein